MVEKRNLRKQEIQIELEIRVFCQRLHAAQLKMKNWLIFKILGNLYTYFHCFRYHVEFQFFLKIVVAETIRGHLYDRKLGVITCMDQHFFRDIESWNKAQYSYYPTRYSVLKKINASISLTPSDILVDIGSGKGRVVFFFASQKIRKIIGLESNSAFSNIAENNLKKLKLNNTEIKLHNVDARFFVFTDETIFFIFHPFGNESMGKVIDNIKSSLRVTPRKISIICHGFCFTDLVNLNMQDWLVLTRSISLETRNIYIWNNRLSSF